MYASITTVQTQPGKLDEFIRSWRDSVLPMAKQQKGWRSAYLVTDRNTGKTVVFGLWETEADAIGFQTSGAWQKAVTSLAELTAGQPVREIYEVSAQA